MIRATTVRLVCRCIGVAAVVAALCTPAHALRHAHRRASAASPSSDAWMPDVRERVAELRDRQQQAAQEARAHRDEDAVDGQWWRIVAARPAQAVQR